MNIKYQSILAGSMLFLLFVLPQCQVPKDQHTSLVNYDSIRILLEPLYDKDQGIREVYMSQNHLNDSSFLAQMHAIDHNNQIVLVSILEKYGWIPSSKIGEKASDALYIIIQHSDTSTMEKYFPQLKLLAEAGEASSVDAATMQDRLLLRRGEKQIYGTQAFTTKMSDSKLIWPVANPTIVDSLRKSAGFELNIRDNAERLGAVYDPQKELPLDVTK